MRIPVVRDRDSTTTGGRVIALKAKIHDKGVKLALRGEHATCGNCKGTWPMYGTGDQMRNQGTPVVLDGDRVLCPCEKNRVIAGKDAKCFVHKDTDAKRPTVTASISQGGSVIAHDEQFTLIDANLNILGRTYYTIRHSDGSLVHGITDSDGLTERHKTNGAQTIALYLGHRESTT